jgi:monoamine oxidase
MAIGRRRSEVLVVGAGAAGLSAARTLSQAGKTVTVIEARPRIGGRIHTLRESGAPLPIELGAEFIHGEAEDTLAVVRAARLVVDRIPDHHLRVRNGKLASVADYWERIERLGETLAARAAKSPGGDRAVADLLDRAKVPLDLREMFVDFIEGYHAADPEKMSGSFLGSGDSEAEDAGNHQFRVVSGYDGVVQWLRSGLDPERVDLRLNTIATKISWKRNEIRLSCKTGVGAELDPFVGGAIIVTLPHGVLKAKSVVFEPPLPAKKRAVERLEAGVVMKIVCQFREAFWQEDRFLRDRMDKGSAADADLTFVHSSDADVPTWWTALPARAPMLTGWAGARRGESLLRDDEQTRVERCLTALSKTLSFPRRRLDELLEAWWTHDWESDPFSRGAYTYPRVGGMAAQRALARPVEGTLFFAGEATDPDQTATVAGAIASGRRAANQLLRRSRD